jgi:hypothetical protein
VSRSPALLLTLSLLGAAGDPDSRSADEWCSRVADALRVEAAMAAHARMVVKEPGERDFVFGFDMLRRPSRSDVRTVFEMQEEGDPRAAVMQLVVARGQPLVNWWWDIQKRRWLFVKGIQATDPFADSLFRYEDLWLTDPAERRRGAVRWVEADGRRFLELESEPYHYYLRVVTRVDPDSALPVAVRFFDNTGAPIREQRFEAVETIDGRPFPKVVRLRDLVTGAESVLTYERIEFRKGIPPSFVDRSVLHDRITKGVDPLPLDAIPDRGDPEAGESPAAETRSGSDGI